MVAAGEEDALAASGGIGGDVEGLVAVDVDRDFVRQGAFHSAARYPRREIPAADGKEHDETGGRPINQVAGAQKRQADFSMPGRRTEAYADDEGEQNRQREPPREDDAVAEGPAEDAPEGRDKGDRLNEVLGPGKMVRAVMLAACE